MLAASRKVMRIGRQIVSLSSHQQEVPRSASVSQRRPIFVSSGASMSMAPDSNLGDTAFVEANGHRFFVVRAGGASGGTPVICMPGAMGTAETDFPKQLQGLSGRHQVVSCDPRGYGKSRSHVRDWPEDFYHRDAEDVHAIMQALGYASYSVIGWSDGANAAVILAAKRPEAVQKLVIFGGHSYIEQRDIDGYEATRNVKKSWSKRMLDLHMPVYGDDLQATWDGACEAKQAIMARGGDICQGEAKTIKCPTFVLGGAKDPIAPNHHAEWFAKHIPDAKLHVFPDGKHNIHMKYGEEFNKLVLNFLSE